MYPCAIIAHYDWSSVTIHLFKPIKSQNIMPEVTSTLPEVNHNRFCFQPPYKILK